MSNNQTSGTAGGGSSPPRVAIGDFFRQVRQEANKVSWPSRKETLITTEKGLTAGQPKVRKAQ